MLVDRVSFEVGGGGIVEDQVDIEAEQVGGAQEHRTLDLVGPDGEAVERTIELMQGEVLGRWQVGAVRQPARRTGQFRARVIETLRRHGEQRPLVRRGQFAFGDAAADRRADAELLPEGLSGEHDAKFDDGVDLDVGEAGLVGCGDGAGGISIDDALDGDDQALQGGFVELIGAAEVWTTCASERLVWAFQTFSARA